MEVQPNPEKLGIRRLLRSENCASGLGPQPCRGGQSGSQTETGNRCQHQPGTVLEELRQPGMRCQGQPIGVVDQNQAVAAAATRRVHTSPRRLRCGRKGSWIESVDLHRLACGALELTQERRPA